MDNLVALASGLAAGLGLAAPLGVVGVLLIREGLERGLRAGAPAAAGVAFVDALYCVIAVLAGAVVAPVVSSWGSIPSLVGGVVLVLIGVHGAVRSWREGDASAADAVTFASRTGPRRFLLFVGLTAINPATLLYFAAVTVALGAALTNLAAASAFVIGVAAASFCWQLGLVVVGTLLRTRITRRAQRLLSLGGFSMVIALGIAAIVAAALSHR